jgi:hypothetical protein
MAEVILRISDQEEIEIVDGPDDICAPMLDEDGAHCHRASVIARDRAAATDLGAVLGVTAMPGARLVLDARVLRSLRNEFEAGRVRSACEGCEWTTLCSSVAAARYAGTILGSTA